MAYARKGLMQMIGVGDRIAGTVALAASVSCLVGALTFLLAALEFRSDGVYVMGRVDACWGQGPDCIGGVVATCPECTAAYAYEVEGQTYHGIRKTQGTTYDILEDGARVMVRYLPRDPTRSFSSFSPDAVDRQGGNVVGALIVGVIGYVSLLGFNGLLWAPYRRARRMVWLRENGIRREATVISQEVTPVDAEGPLEWRIRWKDEAGQWGQSEWRQVDDLPPVGATIVVYADPAGRQAAVWEGDSGTR
jgi:hypothetical protein